MDTNTTNSLNLFVTFAGAVIGLITAIIVLISKKWRKTKTGKSITSNVIGDITNSKIDINQSNTDNSSHYTDNRQYTNNTINNITKAHPVRSEQYSILYK